ncbi:DUF4286 family protein [bacterium AH-315-M05]|nr:DUF4286 family protein [bacterium AH-315-M05]
MIIYNVKVSIDDDVHDEWLKWMKEVHIPDVMKTGMFTDHKICRVLTDDPPAGGQSYSIQYVCKNMDNYNRYREEFAPGLQEEHAKRYKGKFEASRTLLEVV